MINWMLEVEDVEDVACTVDDMKATDRSRSWFRRDGVREGVPRAEMMEGHCPQCCTRRKGCEDRDKVSK